MSIAPSAREFVLETRTCRKCPETFRVLPTSNSRHCSSRCRGADRTLRASIKASIDAKKKAPRLDLVSTAPKEADPSGL